MKVLKLITRILLFPFFFAIGLVYMIGTVLAALSSIVTNLIGTVFVLGAVCGWITHAREDTVWMAAITGIVIFFLPAIVKVLLEILLRIGCFLKQITEW